VAQQRLGLVRAVVIVWTSGAVVGTLLTLLFFQSRLGSTILTGTPSDGHPLRALAWFSAVNALVEAGAVCVGVRIVGFRVRYAVASVALLGAAILLTAIDWTLVSGSAGDTTGIALSAYGVLLLPLRILIGTVAPACAIDAAASAAVGSAPPQPRHYPLQRP
jgi:hypothetical protein